MDKEFEIRKCVEFYWMNEWIGIVWTAFCEFPLFCGDCEIQLGYVYVMLLEWPEEFDELYNWNYFFSKM